MNHSRDTYPLRRFYRDPERGVICGVCAGLAEKFDCPLWLTRLGALALGWFFPLHVVLAYAVAALIMPRRPLSYAGTGDERAFWQSRRYRS